MNKPEYNWHNLTHYLKTLIALLELPPESTLSQEAIALIDFLNKTTFQIAVFAPFNHGKSTLLNALLGQKSLPIDLVPSTGAAIKIKYGKTIQTKITFQDGREKITSDTKILQKYAILNSDRTMRNDLKKVEVTCNYPLLKQGVELLDLPGTNDREAQDNLVKDKLLTADLIIHVLDARKLMTLLEREKLRDWLQGRGIHTVIFVVNFLNLLTESEQKKICNRLKFVAKSFRSELPIGISNLYPVDALPALRARLKGDYHKVIETGLVDLETALQNIIKAKKSHAETKIARIESVTKQLMKLTQDKIINLQGNLENNYQKQQQKIVIKQKASRLIKQGLQRSISEFESWLYLPNLLRQEQANLAIALQQDNFKFWKNEFNHTIKKHQQAIISWLDRIQEFFVVDKKIELLINFPEPPKIRSEDTNANQERQNNRYESKSTPEIERIFSTAVESILSGNGRDFLTRFTNNNRSRSNTERSETKPQKSLSQLYAEAATAYLTLFSERAFIHIKEYHERVEKLIHDRPQPIVENETKVEHQIKLLENAIANLRQELNNLKSIVC